MKPTIAITIGDPAGIGPEIVVKALHSPEVQDACYCKVIGNKKLLENTCAKLGLSKDIFISKYAEICEPKNCQQEQFPVGEINSKCGEAAFQYIKESIHLVKTGKAQAVATAPINKESLQAANIPYIGHTEIFGALTNTENPITMFEVHGMRIFFLTRHVSLKKACSLIKKQTIIEYVIRCTDALKKLGVTSGTMAIAGLNPHSGEHGLFGDEEVLEIFPAVKELQNLGYNVVGPIGADSVFHQTLIGKFNSVLSLYHDQGHIAAKTLDFERTISVTCGMNILRTSVDHGTAFDIAGKNIASPVSMIESIILAAKYCKFFNHPNF